VENQPRQPAGAVGVDGVVSPVEFEPRIVVVAVGTGLLVLGGVFPLPGVGLVVVVGLAVVVVGLAVVVVGLVVVVVGLAVVVVGLVVVVVTTAGAAGTVLEVGGTTVVVVVGPAIVVVVTGFLGSAGTTAVLLGMLRSSPMCDVSRHLIAVLGVSRRVVECRPVGDTVTEDCPNSMVVVPAGRPRFSHVSV